MDKPPLRSGLHERRGIHSNVQRYHSARLIEGQDVEHGLPPVARRRNRAHPTLQMKSLSLTSSFAHVIASCGGSKPRSRIGHDGSIANTGCRPCLSMYTYQLGSNRMRGLECIHVPGVRRSTSSRML